VSTPVAVIAAVATVLAALIGYLGVRLTRASSREANATEQWAKLAEANDAQNERLMKEIADLRAHQGRQDERIDQQRDRIDEVERKLESEQRVNRTAFDYIRTLLRWIEQRMPGATPPEPPALLKGEIEP
jgi:chromosome segregation ATPase